MAPETPSRKGKRAVKALRAANMERARAARGGIRRTPTAPSRLVVDPRGSPNELAEVISGVQDATLSSPPVRVGAASSQRAPARLYRSPRPLPTAEPDEDEDSWEAVQQARREARGAQPEVIDLTGVSKRLFTSGESARRPLSARFPSGVLVSSASAGQGAGRPTQAARPSIGGQPPRVTPVPPPQIPSFAVPRAPAAPVAAPAPVPAGRPDRLNELNRPPCTNCVKSAMAGMSDGKCYKASRGDRCYRCSSGHKCEPLSADVLPFARAFMSNLDAPKAVKDRYRTALRVAFEQLDGQHGDQGATGW